MCGCATSDAHANRRSRTTRVLQTTPLRGRTEMKRDYDGHGYDRRAMRITSPICLGLVLGAVPPLRGVIRASSSLRRSTFLVRFRPPVTATVQVVTDDETLEGASQVRTVRIQEHNHLRVVRTSARRARFSVTFDGPTRVPLEPRGSRTRLGPARQVYLYATRVGRPYAVRLDQARLRFDCHAHGCVARASGAFAYSHRVAWAAAFFVCTRAQVFIGVGDPERSSACGASRLR